jgi:RimJ/RimL family protein N-acetyltransferase
MTVILRPVVEADFPVFYLQQADELAARMADFPMREERAFYDHWQKIMADSVNVLRTIVYDGQVTGNVISFLMEGKREVGYWIGREFWGKGIATSALRLFLKEVAERPLNGVAARTNAASLRVLQKCGFVFDHETEKEICFRLD